MQIFDFLLQIRNIIVRIIFLELDVFEELFMFENFQLLGIDLILQLLYVVRFISTQFHDPLRESSLFFIFKLPSPHIFALGKQFVLVFLHFDLQDLLVIPLVLHTLNILFLFRVWHGDYHFGDILFIFH